MGKSPGTPTPIQWTINRIPEACYLGDLEIRPLSFAL
jgi:hypothetical protein